MKFHQKAIKFFLLATIGLLPMLLSCEKEETKPAIPESDSIYWFVNELMHTWYYWYDQVPVIDYSQYNSPEQLMNELKVDQDKWSFIGEYEEVMSYFDEGEDFGYGFYLAWDSYYNLRVIMAYENTTAYTQGIRRGYIVEEINDEHVQDISSFDAFFSIEPGSMKFKFIKPDGQVQTLTLEKEVYLLDAVFNPQVYVLDNKKIGYLAYQSFLGYSVVEFDDVFAFLKAEGINELIVDLRYNGGGYISLAQEMAEIIVPANSTGQEFISIKHNNLIRAYEDTTLFLRNHSMNLDLDRVFFITNRYSASASELVINGLEPHMEVIQIGDTTTGKPYAMYGFLFHDWLAYPVTAKSVNALGYGDYENGILPDLNLTDNHAYDWGDINDPAVVQALNYIQYGSFGNIYALKQGTGKSDILGTGKSLGQHWLIADQ